ncbi:hypothetical protein BC628DRAFT_1035802 [Trametes gibbosa]|nr:hypothetical protein BC628DRAFT_1035802 [Trametes gibbosa]
MPTAISSNIPHAGDPSARKFAKGAVIGIAIAAGATIIFALILSVSIWRRQQSLLETAAEERNARLTLSTRRPALRPRKDAPSSLPTNRVTSQMHAAPHGYEPSSSSRVMSVPSSINAVVSSDLMTTLPVEGDSTSPLPARAASQQRTPKADRSYPPGIPAPEIWRTNTGGKPGLAGILRRAVAGGGPMSDVPSTLPPPYNDS